MKSNTINKSTNITFLFCLVLVMSCHKIDSCNFEIYLGTDVESEIQNALNTVGEGCKIEFGEGTFEITRTLTMDDKSDVTLEGRGLENTIFSFEGQVSGAEGFLIANSENIIVRNLTIRDTQGDGLKFRNSHGIVMSKVGTVWSGEPSEDNGAYGLYPVLSSNILIEDCYAFGAADAGIYVGQSDKAIIRDSEAEGNVIGIEIENTTNADVHDNSVHNNAAGIIVVNLPDLSQNGARTRVFDNSITNNLLGNFAHEGHIAAETPAGTGILILSVSEVEIFDNTLSGNNVVGTAVASYGALVALGLVPEPQDPNFSLFPENIYIHGNSYSRSNTYPAPEDQSAFGNLLVQSFGANPIPDIILDGIWAPESGDSGSICIENNEGSSFVNLNVANNFPNNLSFDSSPHACSMDPLPAVTIDVPGS